MMNKKFFGIIISITLLVSALALSCNLAGEDPPEYGSLTVQTGSSSARTIEPTPSELNITSYRVTGIHEDGITNLAPVTSLISPITVDKLIVGIWSITVDGLNSEEVVVASKTLEVSIVATETTSATFNLAYVSGSGDFKLTIEWPEMVTSIDYITADLTPAVAGKEGFIVSASEANVVSGVNTIMRDLTELPTDTYSLTVKFFDSSSNQIGLTMMERVNIYDGMVSAGIFSMPEETFPVEAPTYNPKGGRIDPDQEITLSTTTEGAAIYYTIDGTDPTSISNVYSSPFTLPSNKTVKAIALRDDMFASAISLADFEIPAAAPGFSVESGTYNQTQSVILFSTTSGADIYYTTDNSIPTISSNYYDEPIAVKQDTKISAIAVHDEFGNSDVTSAEYFIRSAEPTFSLREGNYGSSQTIELTTEVEGASIYYTLDGSEPTTSSTKYTGPITINATTEIRAIASEANMADSIVTSRTYTILTVSAVSDPVFTPSAGTYPSTQSVEITTDTIEATIYYTTDGSEPDKESTKYSEPLKISESMTLKAYAVKDGMVDSATVTSDYGIQVAAPTFSHESGIYSDSISVTLASVTPDAEIYYTINGTDPRVGGTLYSVPLSITSSSSTTIKAYAVKVSMPDSEIATVEYTIGGSSGMAINDPSHYTVGIVPPSTWTGDAVKTDVYATFSLVINPTSPIDPIISWYLDGVLVSNQSELVLGDSNSDNYIRTASGPHIIYLELTIGDFTISDSLIFVSSSSGVIGSRKESFLQANDLEEGDYFGEAVSLSNDIAIVGAHKDRDNGSNSGSAYIFTRNSNTGIWEQTTKLLPDDGVIDDFFGQSVSLSEDTALVGATGSDDNGSNSGSAYIFTRNGSTGIWEQTAKLLPDDGASGDYFGGAVSLSNNIAIVGATGNGDNGSSSGSAYIFTRNSSTGIWEQTAKLLPSDGASDDYFGVAVSLSNDKAIVGAHKDRDNGSNSGSAYIFTRNSSTGIWEQTTKLLPDDGVIDDYFGGAVSLSNNIAIVGAAGNDDNGSSSGSAYIFTRNGSTGIWEQTAKLLPSDGATYDGFGSAVSLSNNIAIVGAAGDDDNGSSSGSAYIFTRNISTGIWEQADKLLASDGGTTDFFGRSIFFSGKMVIVGANAKDSYTGSAYIFTLL